MDFGSQLDLIAEKAPALRKAGVTEVSVGGVAFKLTPAESELPPGLQKLFDEQTKEQGEKADPLNDASTYGLPPGTDLPGFKRLIDQRQE